MSQFSPDVISEASEFNVDLINRLLPSIPEKETHKRDTLIYYRKVLMLQNLESFFNHLDDAQCDEAIESLRKSTSAAKKSINDMNNYANYIEDAAEALNFLAKAIGFILPFLIL